jgi:hypothetical protein
MRLTHRKLTLSAQRRPAAARLVLLQAEVARDSCRSISQEWVSTMQADQNWQRQCKRRGRSLKRMDD